MGCLLQSPGKNKLPNSLHTLFLPLVPPQLLQHPRIIVMFALRWHLWHTDGQNKFLIFSHPPMPQDENEVATLNVMEKSPNRLRSAIDVCKDRAICFLENFATLDQKTAEVLQLRVGREVPHGHQ